MKLSFSTLGCPNWKWNEIVSAAKDLGYHGIEIRGVGSDIYVPDVKIFAAENIEKTKNDLAALGLEIPCIDSACYLHLSNKDYMKEALEYIDLAAALNAPFVRVLGDTYGEPGEDVYTDLVAQRLIELAPKAQNKGVTLLLETNGVFANSLRTKALMEKVNHPNVAVLWDIHHPYRYNDETFEFTWKALGRYIRHIHVKDSKITDNKLKYKMLGQGALPIPSLIKLLKSSDYSGYFSLEWLKRWNQELEDAGIVFAHFVSIVNYLWSQA